MYLLATIEFTDQLIWFSTTNVEFGSQLAPLIVKLIRLGESDKVWNNAVFDSS